MVKTGADPGPLCFPVGSFQVGRVEFAGGKAQERLQIGLDQLVPEFKYSRRPILNATGPHSCSFHQELLYSQGMARNYPYSSFYCWLLPQL